MRRNMRWEAPSMPTSAHDPGLLRDIHVYQYIFILVYLSIYGVTEDSKVYSLHARRKSNMIQMMVNLHHYIYLSIYLFISANRRNAHSANKLEHTHPCMPSTYSAQMLARTKLWLQRFVSVRASTLIYARVRCEMFFASLYVVLIQSLACSCEFVALYVTLWLIHMSSWIFYDRVGMVIRRSMTLHKSQSCTNFASKISGELIFEKLNIFIHTWHVCVCVCVCKCVPLFVLNLAARWRHMHPHFLLICLNLFRFL